MKQFFALAAVQQMNHTEALELFQGIIEYAIELDQKLTKKLQYLNDSIEKIAKEFDIELANMKQEVTETT